MKRSFPFVLLIASVLWIAAGFFPPKTASNEIDLVPFAKVPVLVGGRIKPLDTVARNSLLIIRSKETLRLSDGKQISAIKWLADTLFNAPLSDQYPAFVIQNAEVLGLFGWQQSDQKYFSSAELEPFLRKIEEQANQADKLQSVERSAYQNAVINLRNALILYQRLKNSVQPEGALGFSDELQDFKSLIPAAARAARHREKGEAIDQTELDRVTSLVQRYDQLAESAYVRVVPAPAPSSDWRSIGEALTQSITEREIAPVAELYASIGDAYRAGDRNLFEEQVSLLSNRIAREQIKATERARYEFFFNQVDPFTHSMVLYVAAFLLACFSWLAWNRPLNRGAFYLLLLALAVHSFGLFSRMYLQERPPVTNLYSSAIFIGWGAVIVALILERIFRDGIGAACAGAIGFITLIIAHHLAGSGDTLEMLQAVLDTNIWLATHVVAITTGYSAMFLAGMLAIIYIVRGVFTPSLNKETSDSLARMTYGVVCFATLFSFVGTVLGGIWADQSWGRFWGWDPKENGAVLIVLWCAIILHARWGGFIGQRGLMIMAIFGNVVTSFSWFGVNMLGVGLHSYGFMQKAFPWLVGFIVSQLALMAVAAMPLERWHSFRSRSSAPGGRDQRNVNLVSPRLATEGTLE
jgi:ABC-type transport system involved in cytochrome c biogenesis permease subunit